MNRWYKNLRAWEREAREHLPKARRSPRRSPSEWLRGCLLWVLLVFLLTKAATGPDHASLEREMFGQSVVFAALGLIFERIWRSAVQLQMIDGFFYLAPTPDDIARAMEIRTAIRRIAIGLFLSLSVMAVIVLVEKEPIWWVLCNGSCALMIGAVLSRFIPWSGRLAFALIGFFAICTMMDPAASWFHSWLAQYWDGISMIWPPLWAYRELNGWEWPAIAALGLLGAGCAWRDSRGGKLDRERFFSEKNGLSLPDDDGEDWGDGCGEACAKSLTHDEFANTFAGRPEALVWRWLTLRQKILTRALSMAPPLWSPRLKWSIGWFLLSYSLLLLASGWLAPLLDRIEILGTILNYGVLLMVLGAAAAVWPPLGGFGKEWLGKVPVGSLGMASALSAYPVSLPEFIQLRWREIRVRSAFAAPIYAVFSFLAMDVLGWRSGAGVLDFVLWVWTVYWAVLAFSIEHVFLELQATISDRGTRYNFFYSVLQIMLFLGILGASGLCLALPFAIETVGSRAMTTVVLNPLALGFAWLGLRLVQRLGRNPRLSLILRE